MGNKHDKEIQEFIEKTKYDMRMKCALNIDRINYACAYGGESFAKHKDCFEASKEFLWYDGFPSCYSEVKE